MSVTRQVSHKRGQGENGYSAVAGSDVVPASRKLTEIQQKAAYLDLVPVPVMAIDREHTILYLNPAAAKMAGQDREASLGAKFWDLFDNPNCRAGTCGGMQAVREGRIVSGETTALVQGKQLHLKTTSAPLPGADRQVVGFLVVLDDIEGQVQAGEEILRLVGASREGQLTERGKADQFEGRYRQLIQGINEMLDAILLPIGEGNRILRLIRGGNLREKVEIACKGDHAKMKDAINGVHDWLTELISYVTKIANGDMTAAMAKASDQDQIHEWLALMKNNINALISDVSLLAKSAVEGKLETRADASKHQGDYQRIVEGVNQTLDSVVTPLKELGRVIDAMAGGDLTVLVNADYAGDFDVFKKSVNKLASQVRAAIGQIGKNVSALASASEELNKVSQQMGSSAEETATQANVVSAASEQVTKNVQTVATGADEMGASIKEIAKNTAEATRVAASAVKTANSTNETINKLGQSSAEIGQVIKVITSIAQQTNLLALNATIEAARAGEAGKGFAVVANEVKELAKETAKATEDISRKIEAIQGDTSGAVAAIGQISTVIGQISDIQNTIASAIEEQSATTNEIGRNLAEAAKGSTDISRNIGGVAEAARATAAGAGDTLKSAESLEKMAADLQVLVGQFRY
jgi:methyl-accepting chemotaxis protein